MNKQQATGNGFNFENKRLVTLSLTASDLQNLPIALTGIQFFDQNPMVINSSDWKDNVTPFLKMQTDTKGSVNAVLTLGSTIDTVYVHIANLNYSAPIAIPVTSGNISLNLHPYGKNKVLQSPALFRSPTEIVATPWKYETTPYNAGSNLWILGNYSTKGYPSYLIGRDTYSSSFINSISATFPEKTNMITKHPEFFTDGTTSNLKTTAPCQIWVSFLSEGAWDNNSVGYFYYPTGSAPANAASVSKRIIIFPNVQDGSGNSGNYLGSMVQGDKVSLMYQNPETGVWTDVFPADITLGWFIINKGYSTAALTKENVGMQLGTTYYSIPSFNPDAYQHNIIYHDEVTQSSIIGFEDISIGATSDKDFNDVVFAITSNPITAVDKSKLPTLIDSSSTDLDGDGVLDTNDAYPNDPLRAYNSYYPTTGTGTLSFEDKWPALGDYDFNDLVIGYRYQTVLNAYNEVKDVKATFNVEAVGAVYRNGFALQFGTGAGNVESVSGQRNMSGNSVFDISSAGYENGQSYAVIPVFPDAHQLFGYTSETPYINTGSGSNQVQKTPETINLNVTFERAVLPTALGSAPFNAFMVVDKQRGKEIHLAGQIPTSKADVSLFGKGDDKTNGTTIFYKNNSNYPWALDVPANLAYPKEASRIDNAYLKYSSWATSSGASYSDWYDNTASDYRNNSAIYKK
ncbi:MAG: LruC domain-containing protein [Paludibacteraceae bacterium]